MGTPLNMNQSSRAELAAHPAIGQDRATAIIGARPFAQWSDLLRAEGVNDALAERLQGEGAVLGAPGDGKRVGQTHPSITLGRSP